MISINSTSSVIRRAHRLENHIRRPDGGDDLDKTTIDIRQAIIQGSFLPVALICLAGHFPVNDYIVDRAQGAKLVHYIGQYGHVKALKTFLT